jgi:hypothetical protein
MLIFQNGTAYFDAPQATSDIDENGKPIAGAAISLEVPCYIEFGSESRNGKTDDGKIPRLSFTVSFDYDSVGADFNPSVVRVVHNYKGDLGTYTIQRLEHYDLTRTIQVWV